MKVYASADWQESFESMEFNGIIGLFNTTDVFKLQFMHDSTLVNQILNEIDTLSEKKVCIRDCILNDAEYAACDGSKKI